MSKKTTKSGSGAMKLAMLGASLAGLAATAYFLFGPKAKKNQRQAKAWAIKMKADVIEKLEVAREVSEPAYRKIIDAVAAEYGKAKKADRKDISALAQDLKKHWRTISRAAKSAKKAAKNA